MAPVCCNLCETSPPLSPLGTPELPDMANGMDVGAAAEPEAVALPKFGDGSTLGGLLPFKEEPLGPLDLAVEDLSSSFPEGALDDLMLPQEPWSASLFGTQALLPTAVPLDADMASVPISPQRAPTSPDTLLHFEVHVKGYKQTVEVDLASSMSVNEALAEILHAQASHPRAILPSEHSRVVMLTCKPRTMNTTCKFEEKDTIQRSDTVLLAAYQHLRAIFLYLVCPERPLSNENGVHRRLAKRDVGVCEAHREKIGRARKRGEKSGFVVPSIRARITANGGKPVDMSDLDEVQRLWMEQMPQFLKAFMEQRGLEVEQIQINSAHPGSIIFDFDVTFKSADAAAAPLSPQEQLALQQQFFEWMQAQQAAAEPFGALAPLEIDYMDVDFDADDAVLWKPPAVAELAQAAIGAAFAAESMAAAPAGPMGEVLLESFGEAGCDASSLRQSVADMSLGDRPPERQLYTSQADLCLMSCGGCAKTQGGFIVPNTDNGLLTAINAMNLQRCNIARIMTETCARAGIDRTFDYRDVELSVIDKKFYEESPQTSVKSLAGFILQHEQELQLMLHSSIFEDAQGRSFNMSVWKTDQPACPLNPLYEHLREPLLARKKMLADLLNFLLERLRVDHHVRPLDLDVYALYDDVFDYDSEIQAIVRGENPFAQDYEPPTKSDVLELRSTLHGVERAVITARPSTVALQRNLAEELR